MLTALLELNVTILLYFDYLGPAYTCCAIHHTCAWTTVNNIHVTILQYFEYLGPAYTVVGHIHCCTLVTMFCEPHMTHTCTLYNIYFVDLKYCD